MVQKSSIMLGEMINEKIGAPARVVPAQFTNSIDSSSFEYGSIWHQLLQFHVQFHSKMLHDHESINRNDFCVKNLQNIFERKNLVILESRSEKCG